MVGIDGRATVWVDSNVMAEIMSQGDLYRDYRRGAVITEQRRMMAQCSLWLAMALDDAATVTVSYEHETTRVIQRLAPPGSDAGQWTWAWAALLKPYVFPRWIGYLTEQGVELAENDERDQLMVDLCRADGFTLVSRDKGAQNRARAAGVPVVTPEEYATAVMTRDAARERFFERLAVAGLHSPGRVARTRSGAAGGARQRAGGGEHHSRSHASSRPTRTPSATGELVAYRQPRGLARQRVRNA